MKTIRALIVDDEPLAREIIQKHLAKITRWQVVGTCANAEEALQTLLNTEIDVVFLDIQMPKLSGIEFLRSIKSPPLIVLTTAYNEYAIQGYELDVVDYLLKPILFSRFYQAVVKVEERLNAIKNSHQNEEGKNHHFFKHNGRLVKINFADIFYVKAEQEYSYIYTLQENYLVGMHLKKMEAKLPKSDFIRIHRSYILNLIHLKSISGNTVYLEDGTSIPLAKSNNALLLERLRIKNDSTK